VKKPGSKMPPFAALFTSATRGSTVVQPNEVEEIVDIDRVPRETSGDAEADLAFLSILSGEENPVVDRWPASWPTRPGVANG
jgi:hypothetical protein